MHDEERKQDYCNFLAAMEVFDTTIEIYQVGQTVPVYEFANGRNKLRICLLEVGRHYHLF